MFAFPEPAMANYYNANAVNIGAWANGQQGAIVVAENPAPQQSANSCCFLSMSNTARPHSETTTKQSFTLTIFLRELYGPMFG